MQLHHSTLALVRNEMTLNLVLLRHVANIASASSIFASKALAIKIDETLGYGIE